MKMFCAIAAPARLYLVLAISLFTATASSQAPLFKFVSPSLIYGTDRQVGAIYRFSNVIPTVDALVEIKAISSGMSLRNIDRTADGYPEAFQPEYRINGRVANGYIDFNIRFVEHGTSTARSMPLVEASGLDIDGSTQAQNTLREFNQIDMGGGVCEFNTMNTQLTVAQNGTAYLGTNATGILYGALVDTAAKVVMFTVSNANITSMNYRVGAINNTNAQSTRYASLYYQRFLYEHLVLSGSDIISFDGTMNEGKVNLKWKFAESNTVKTTTLERSLNGRQFESIADFTHSKNGSVQTNFAYTDMPRGSNNFYYRLRLTDAGGRVEYSNIISFRATTTGAPELLVYPSVVSSTLTVNFQSAERQASEIFITDMAGRVVKKQAVASNQGRNSVIVSGLDQLQKGNYIVAMRSGSSITSRKIVVQ